MFLFLRVDKQREHTDLIYAERQLYAAVSSVPAGMGNN